jgi:hypothetical protein
MGHPVEDFVPRLSLSYPAFLDVVSFDLGSTNIGRC